MRTNEWVPHRLYEDKTITAKHLILDCTSHPNKLKHHTDIVEIKML